MSALPKEVCDYICQIPITNDHLAYFLSDRNGDLHDFGGSVDHYGISGLALNKSMENQIPFLSGLLPIRDHAEVFECLQIASGRYADVHVVRTSAGHIVLLYDTTSQVVMQKRQLTTAREGFISGAGPGARATEVFHEGENLLLNYILSCLDVTILEHQSDDVFKPLGTPPAWFQKFDPVACEQKQFFANQHPFLGNFLYDAAEFWAGDKPGRLRSSVWTEKANFNTEHTLGASALKYGSRNFMLVESLGARHIDHQGVLQRAREAELKFENNIASLEEQNVNLNELAITDGLTELLNRVGFHQEGNVKLAESVSTGKSMLVILIDMNRFKVINDTLGHHVGDIALVAVAETLLSVFRETDVVGRIGGDEFAVVVPGTNESHLERFADRINSLLDEFNQNTEHDMTLALSLGAVHSNPKENENLDDLLKRADERMYADKAARGHQR